MDSQLLGPGRIGYQEQRKGTQVVPLVKNTNCPVVRIDHVRQRIAHKDAVLICAGSARSKYSSGMKKVVSSQCIRADGGPVGTNMPRPANRMPAGNSTRTTSGGFNC